MDLQSLHLFIDVARLGSFSDVARERDMDPSSISRAIAVLEKELDVRLFQRSTRRLSLTEAGALYFERIEPLLSAAEDAGDDARAIGRGPVGTLRLTASVAFGQACLAPLLSKFQAAYPMLRLELLFQDTNLDLVSERIDLAIRLGPSVTADVIGSKLFETHYKVCASPAYLAKAPAMTDPQDLTNHPCLRFMLSGYKTRWRFRAA